MDPFCILPYEMWEAVLDRLEDAQDKLNLARADSTLENAFRSKISNWQLLAILPVLVSHNLDLGMRRLNSTIRKFRLLSSECSRAVDKCIETHWQKFSSPAPFALFKRFTDVQIARNFLAFWREVENHPPNRSPFLSRYFEFRFLVPQDFDENEDGIGLSLRSFFKRFGGNFKRVNFDVEIANGEEVGRSYLFIKDYIALTPNIESLELHLPFYPLPEEMNVYSPLINVQRMNIQVEYIPRRCEPWLNFMQWFPQLMELTFSFDLWKEQSKGLFPRLKRFSLYANSIRGTERKAYKFLKHLDAPKLEELNLKVHYWSLTREADDDDAMYFFKMAALIFLGKLRPECNWNFQKNVPCHEPREFRFFYSKI